jgi:predicted lipoprotein with Yx(FWY)xxD motif
MRKPNQRTSSEAVAIGHAAITRRAGVLALTAMIGVIGFLAAGSIARSATQTNATISLRKTKLGMILVDPRGHTLYLFKRDTGGKSACSGSCAKFWPPLLRHAKTTLGAGVKRSMLGTTRRTTGQRQLTYNKHPLYTFALDKQAGQTRGEGNLAFGAKWYAVSPRGTAIINATTTTTETTTTTADTTTSCRYPPC